MFFTTFLFPTIHSYFSLSYTPPCFESLFASSTGSLSIFTTSTRARKDATEAVSSSFYGSLCYHLVSILSHLLYDASTLSELIRNHKLHSLCDLLLVPNNSGDPLFQLVLHKSLIRCVAILTSSASLTREGIAQMKVEVYS